MNNQELQNHLIEMLIDADIDDERPDLRNADICTFDEAGLMTYDTGIVVTLENGDEFQLTIQRRN